ncbi:Add37p NDAI_0I01010 [Naumovozyma dairenensis CBS 421]|uniref:Uncharacterized protein n=1 Tax=Naumovozyma dairenensis (strain ATCC 10597 / BCRC 20456 / CBS 421 / NBRC 0211 / NRRL Y-12639) TaxID=1071378 RepID=G0WFV9_NAUDC|nr:hypothetical protein NDAI_0I01010 [Naumovozyma dairenensis CBS 421]CCD26670.1 hypothetical protein NDAI_0I01010 [Naumovozyma dairenensis CBS 421]
MTSSVRSFQNCSEADVPGYNDCPSFLFQVNNNNNNKRQSNFKITPKVYDLSGNTKIPTIPPPPLRRINRRSISSRSIISSSSNSEDNLGDDQPPTVIPSPVITETIELATSPTQQRNESLSDVESLSRDELVNKIERLFNQDSKLSEQEFQYYKKKVDSNIHQSLNNDLTKIILTQFFKESNQNQHKAKKLLMDWMVSDMSITNWCPAFLKIVENSTTC